MEEVPGIDWNQFFKIAWPWIAGIGTVAGGALTLACREVWGFLKPWFVKVFNEALAVLTSWKEVGDKFKDREETLNQFSAAFTVLGNVLTAMQQQLNNPKWIVLLVEDAKDVRILVRSVVNEIIDDNEDTLRHLSIKDVDSLPKAYEWQASARIIVLDVTLPDTTVAEVKAFVKICGASCPIIIFTGGGWTDDDFPGAFAFVKKGGSLKDLKGAICRALEQYSCKIAEAGA